MRPNPWLLPRIENVLETSSVIPTWRTRLGPSQLIQSSQDNQCTWHGRYLILILSFWCSFCCFCFSLFLGTDRSVKLTGRSTLVLNEHLWLNQQTCIINCRSFSHIIRNSHTGQLLFALEVYCFFFWQCASFPPGKFFSRWVRFLVPVVSFFLICALFQLMLLKSYSFSLS